MFSISKLPSEEKAEEKEDSEENPFSENQGKADVVLVVRDQRFYVNKTLLTICSPVFEKMFDGEFKEKDAKEVELQDDPKDFLEFLKCLYPTIRKPITDENALSVLKLADKYQVDAMVKDCDDNLTAHCRKLKGEHGIYLGHDSSEVVTFVETAEKYRLKKLLPQSISAAMYINSNNVTQSNITQATQFEIIKGRLKAIETRKIKI